MDFETEVGKCDPFDMECIDAARAKYSGIPSIVASQPVNSLDALNARGLQMEADALTAAGLTSLTDTTLPPGSGADGFDVLSTLSPSQEAKVREAIALKNAEDAYADAVKSLKDWNERRKNYSAADSGDTSTAEDEEFFSSGWKDLDGTVHGGQGRLQAAVQQTKAALEGLGGSPYASLLKRGIVTTAQLAGNIVNRGMNAVGGPNFNQVTLNPLQGSVTGQYSDSGQYTPLKITETADGTIVAASTGIPALDAIIGGSTTTDADGSISGVKTPDFGTIWENVGGAVGAVGALGLSGENTSETFDPTAGVVDDTVVTNPGTVVTLGGLSPQEIAYNKAMKVFDEAGGGEAGKAAVLQALEDNNLSLQDLATQTGVSLDEIKTFLGLGGLTIDGGTTTSTVGPVLPDSATGILGLDTAGPLNLTKRVDIDDPLEDILKRVDYTPLNLTAGIDVDPAPDALTKRVDIGAKPDDITKRVDYSPLDLKKSIDALDQKLELKKGIGALDQQPNVLRSVTLTGEPSIGGGISELGSGPSFGGAVTLETGPNASGTLEHVPGASTRYRSSLGEVSPGAAATLRASLNEGAPGDLKGTLRAGSLEGTLTAGEVFKGEIKGSTSPAEKTSTLRGSSGGGGGGGGGGMDTGGGSPGEGAGEPGDLTEIEYLFQRFGDTIFAPELTKAEENELLYPYR